MKNERIRSKSLSQAYCWTPEGKAKYVENRDWASKKPKHKVFMSKNEAYKRAVFSYENLKKATVQ